VERPKLPLSITGLLGFYIPDVVALGLGFLSIFVETEDVVLSPEIVSNLKESGARARLFDSTYFFHRDLIFRIALPG